MRVGVRGFAVSVVLLGSGLVAPAAALEWQPIETLALTRGVATPQVAVYPDGRALAVYSDATRRYRGNPAIRLAGRSPGNAWRDLGVLRAAAGVDPQLAVAPSGATAIAAVADGRLVVVSYPAPGPAVLGGANAGPPRTASIVGAAVGEPRLGLDDAGNATVVWRSAVSGGVDAAAQVKAVTVDAVGAVGDVESLGPPGDCRPELDVNGRGDAVVGANCASQPADIFYRPAGGRFGPGEAPFGPDQQPYGSRARVGASLDGGGTLHAHEQTWGDGGPGKGALSMFRYAQRPPHGPFGQPVPLNTLDYFDGPLELEAFEDGRVVIAWGSVGEIFYYAVKPAGGGFGPRQELAVRGLASGMSLVASRLGPALLSWRERPDERDHPEQSVAAILGKDGTATVSRIGLPGYFGSPVDEPLAFAIGDGGRAVGVWEQRCSRSGAFGVTATAFDSRSAGAEPPCQDRVAPKVVVRPRSARLVGRTLRVRIGCDEACRIGVRVRVLRGGRGKPLATVKTPGNQRIGPRRYRTFAPRLTAGDAARVRAGLAARHRVTVRLALSVRDGYENGAVRRVAVPLRR